MKEVIKYLMNIKNNIESIDKLRREHKIFLDIFEKENSHFTKIRLNQFKITNNKVSDIILITKHFEL